MPKPNDDIQDLKRRIALLDRLDGRPLTAAEGVVLLDPARVRDPRPLVAACVAGRPALAAIGASLELASPPIALTPSLLATAQRDLRMLEASPDLLAAAREAPRIFRRYGTLDALWLARRRARLARLAEAVRAASQGLPPPIARGDHPAWFARVLEAIELVHGEGAADAVEAALLRLEERGRTRRADARRALDEVVACLAGHREPRSPAIAAAVADLRAAAGVPGRSRARRAAAAIARLFEVPNPDHLEIDRGAPIDAIARAIGDLLLARMGTPRSPASRSAALDFLAHYALAFHPRPRGGGALALGPADVDRGIAGLDRAVAHFVGQELTIDEVLALLELDLDGAIAGKVASGVPIAKVRRLAELGRIKDLAKLESAEAANAYADWAITLAPHYAALGLDFPVPPEAFEDLRASRKIDLAVLAACLMKHHGRASADTAEQAIARLDATLGLFRRRPAEAASILDELAGTSPGAGRAAFPAFAAWLGDDALLDRYVHLARLAGAWSTFGAPGPQATLRPEPRSTFGAPGPQAALRPEPRSTFGAPGPQAALRPEPLALSQALRADFERREAQDRERAHLASLPAPSPAQCERLRRLEAGLVEVPDPSRTRRRLADRVRDLLGQAYEARLDAVFRRILKEVWGISIARLTTGFRDAIRFYLALDDNRDLLGALLRAAAAGVDPARSMPRNRAWIEEVRGRFDVDAWRAPFAREVAIGGEPHRLTAEEDPIEVLRMGIPFDTCLSLEAGSNRASTVVNAVDANKRVLYLRDARGRIVARKLLAVSEDHALVGYRLYIAAQDDHEAIAAAFRDACERIAAAAGLPLAASGKPRQIHAGFWYDDGTVPFDEPPAASPIRAYCRALGVPVPRAPDEQLRREARVLGALRRKDAAALLAALREGWRPTGTSARAAAFLLERRDRGRLAAEARQSTILAADLVRLVAAREGAIAMLDLAGRIADWRSAEVADNMLPRFEHTAEVATAYVSAALASRKNAPQFDDHALEYRSLHTLPALASAIPVAASLALCDRIEPLWAWIEQTWSQCRESRSDAERRMVEAIALRHAAAPDPAAVIRCLESPRSGRLARRAALAIAARHPLGGGATRAIEKLRRRDPSLDEEPAMLAAILRQAGTTAPRGIDLPVPREAPFEALGDLILELDLAPLLERWTGPVPNLDAFQPGPWELAFHRRNATGLRRALLREARRDAPQRGQAINWLALLGDVEAVQEVDPARAPIARAFAAQVEAARTGALPASADAILLGLSDGRDVDAALLRAALARIDRHLAGHDDPSAPLSTALAVTLRARVDREVLRRIVERLLARAIPLGDDERRFVAKYLEDHTTYGCSHLTPDLVVALWQVPGLRRELLMSLGHVGEELFESTYRGVEAAARRAGAEDCLEGLLDAWIAATLDLDQGSTVAAITDEPLLRRAFQVALDRGSPRELLDVYAELDAHEQHGIFLDELSRRPIARSPALDEALLAKKKWLDDPRNAVSAEWLRARLESLPDGSAPGRKEERVAPRRP